MIFGRDCVLGRFFFEIPLFPLFSSVSSVSSVFLVKTMFFKETCFFFLKGLEKDTFQGQTVKWQRTTSQNLHYFLDGAYSRTFFLPFLKIITEKSRAEERK